MSDVGKSEKTYDLNRKEASSYIFARWHQKASPYTLAKYASNGEGPPFQKVGQKFAMYNRDDIDEWARNRYSPGLPQVRRG